MVFNNYFCFIIVICLHLIMRFQVITVIMSSMHHNDTIIIKTDARRKIDAVTKTDAWRKTQEDFFNNILHLTLLQGFERVVQGLHVRGCWRPNINFIFWPHCYDRHVVSFLFSWCWGRLHRGFPRAPSVGCGFPYHIWSLAVWNSTGNCFGSSNSTELNNNSTPTRSPTGSLKSNV